MKRWILPAVLIAAGVFVMARACGGAVTHPAEPGTTTAQQGDTSVSVADTSVATLAPTSTSTSTTVGPLATVGLAQTDQLETREPLVHLLPHDEMGWAIDYRQTAPGAISLSITVKAKLNSERDLATYKVQLAAGKAAALAWLRAHGADPAAYVIRWTPAEAGA